MTLREEMLKNADLLIESNTKDKDFNRRVASFNTELTFLLRKYGLYLGVGYEDSGDDDQLIVYDRKDQDKVSYIDVE